ncbi:hypothetical protein V512_001445 [Mesotoga sp. Brook.08.105.5.1]|nr:hypothetical protein V512_001445 [Mesotoga sp. Brook.08.105.5.1]RAO98167.1 hypothetical protein M388_07470 [Mesotoga sp. Brook.08.YT.4.2.5.4.]
MAEGVSEGTSARLRGTNTESSFREKPYSRCHKQGEKADPV